ncbi:MAG: ATPase [Acidobacteriota bacterium]|nr:ATPase [Acidobacteriota bacterium]
MRRFYLGVDGGQSSTTALIADETGRVIGMGQSGPCNHVAGAEARTKFMMAIDECLSQAAQSAGSSERVPEFAAACLGLSGGVEDKAAYAREAIRSSRLKVTHDAEIALAGALGGEAGIIIIAGTGSIAFGRNAEGRTARAGGWGHIFGDEGGAFDIVRRALRACLQHEEGWGVPTLLRDHLLRATGTADANQLLHQFYNGTARQHIAALAPIVTECATEGDEVAQKILAESARALCWYVEGVNRNLFTAEEKVAVAHIGGVFQSAPVLAAFTERIEADMRAKVMMPRSSPVAGALLEALRMDGNTSTLSELPSVKT